MKKIIIIAVIMIGLLILNKYQFTDEIYLESQCTVFTLGSHELSTTRIIVEGEIMKNLFSHEGQGKIKLKVGDQVYPVSSDIFESYPVSDYLQVNTYHEDDYIRIPLLNKYWNHKNNLANTKNHGMLYINSEKNTIFYVPENDTDHYEYYYVDTGDTIMGSGVSILNLLETMEEKMGWNLSKLIQYYQSH